MVPLMSMAMLVAYLLTIQPVAARSYDEALATQYAELAGAAYCDAEVLTSWTCGKKCIPGVNSVQVCQGTTTQAYVGLWKDSCFVAFEGTNGLDSVDVDLSTATRMMHGFPVHHGFVEEWWSLKVCIKSTLESIGCGSKAGLRATGHSLGGAVCTLAVFDLKLEGWDIVEVYTFGQPRVGKFDFVLKFDALFQGTFFRVTHGRDPFIDMPAGPWYKHVVPEVFYKGTVPEGFAICDNKYDPDDLACAGKYFPDGQWVMSSSAVAWHHDYMGVDTSAAGCKASKQVACDSDIPGSWCLPLIPCNKDVRGSAAYCDLWHRMCRCSSGFCPVDGRCVPTLLELSALDEGSSSGNVSSIGEESTIINLGSSTHGWGAPTAVSSVMVLCWATTAALSSLCLLLSGKLLHRLAQRGELGRDLQEHLIEE